MQQQHPGYAAPISCGGRAPGSVADAAAAALESRLAGSRRGHRPRSAAARARGTTRTRRACTSARGRYPPVAPQYGGYYAAPPPPQLLAPPPPPPLLGSSPPLNTRSYSDNNGHNGHRNRRGGRRGNNRSS